LKNLKSIMSAIFKHARRMGYLDTQNPVQDSTAPIAPESEETYAYSLAEVRTMLAMILDPMAQAIVATAAYTGMRRSEIQGLEWGDWHDGAIYVTRSKTGKALLEPKTRSSKAPVPVVSTLSQILTEFRRLRGHPQNGPMFASLVGSHPDLNNVLQRQILPLLNRCESCGKSRTEHKAEDHPFKRNERLPAWRGWHAFRRGVATNLHALGVPDKTIQSVLRHSNVSTTQRCYIKVSGKATVAAMDTLESVLRSTCALEAAAEGEEKSVN
jgi:integrase